jgi:hypothetical protein
MHNIVASSDSQTLFVRSAFRAESAGGVSSLQEPAPPKNLNIGKSSSLVDELHTILQSLPKEVEYDGRFCIEWGSEDLVWKNQRRDGLKKADAASNAKFGKAVEIVQELIRKAE